MKTAKGVSAVSAAGGASPAKAARREAPVPAAKYPGLPRALDGSVAIVEMETAAGEGAGAYPITPSTQMGEGWAAAVAAGKTNVHGGKLVFFEPEGEHAAAAVTAGLSMTGMRAANFSSGQGVAYMHESLYAAAGKRLTYVLNMACRAMTKQALNVHCGHDDYHAVDDTGFFQLFAKDVQAAADLNLVAHRVAELALNPGICAQDGFLTSHVIESMRLPEPGLIQEYLGDPADMIESPTPAQRLVFGARRRRIPEMFDIDYPAMLGVVQNQDAYAQGVAAQRPYYFDHVADLTNRAFEEFLALTGRSYARAMGYRLENADWVIAGQGSVVSNAEAVADHLRATRGLKVGVLDLVMFRPFPSDLVVALLKGKKGVAVLERVDQPLSVDAPLLREIRAAMSQALENGRAKGGQGAPPAPQAAVPHPTLPGLSPSETPDFYSGCFGLGSRDLQPSDLIAAVENMLEGASRRRRFYLGIDFVRKGTHLPKLEIWQQQILDAYPHVADLTLAPGEEVNLLPTGSLALRMHSVGGWGAITTGKNLALAVYEMLGLHVKANPKYGSEKKGQPTTFFAVFAPESVRLNGELKHVDVVLSPDPKVFQRADPLAGLAKGGVFVCQADGTVAQFWAGIPAASRRILKERGIKVFVLDGFKIAKAEASEPDLVFRLQGAAFMGAFWRATPLAARHGLDEKHLWDGLRAQIEKKFGKLGGKVVEDNLRVIRRGFEEVVEVDVAAMPEAVERGRAAPPVPSMVMACPVAAGIGDPGRFWEQVGSVQAAGEDVLSDPFTAISAIPAATGVFRDMTGIRQEVPQFVAEHCTGCGQCWVQCPDAAIPGLVSEVDDVLRAAMSRPEGSVRFERLLPLTKPFSAEIRKALKADGFKDFVTTLDRAWTVFAPRAQPDAEKRAPLDVEFATLRGVLATFPIARTRPFFDGPEGREKGTGGLLSVTVNPVSCKGCNVCVAVCPEHALVAVKQTDDVVADLRKNWKVWERLPDTRERYVNVPNRDEGIGVLSTLLLRKDVYRSMVGGDGACMGCGEKTSVHLVVSAVRALLEPRVAKHVERLRDLMAKLDAKARTLLASEADLATVKAAGAADGSGAVPIALAAAKQAAVSRLADAAKSLKDLEWRYTTGPGGHGRSMLGIANSTGCSSVWGGTYPYNPYPFPWVNHLFQDSPSIAIGLFEGSMRKMARGFAAIRKAQLLLDDAYDPGVHNRQLSLLDWEQFTDEEMALCPPMFAVGGDGAMLDIGFQNLSRLLASDKPIRVVVLDTQVYSNTGGQACTSGFTGQVSDMAAYGAAQHGKSEVRKELSLIAIAHRGAYVLQSSQASPSHLLAGVLKGLNSKHPAVFNLYTPCPVEHGLGDDASPHAARLALESRAFPFLVFDPAKGPAFADALSLEGNPAVLDRWPTYELEHLDDDGKPAKVVLPLTIADWALTEGRFSPHFKRVKREAWSEEMVPFAEHLLLSADDRKDKKPYILAIDDGRRLVRVTVSSEIVKLADERQGYWSQLKQLAGLEVAPSTLEAALREAETAFAAKIEALKSEHAAELADMRERLPAVVARRMAEGILQAGKGDPTFAAMIARLPAGPPPPNGTGLGGAATWGGAAAPPFSPSTAVAAPKPSTTPAAAPAPLAPPPSAAAAAADEDEALVVEAFIESDRCTTCNECTNLNRSMFAYNERKQAYVKDARAGTFQQLVLAAERCPVSIIHPGTPLNPKEKDLAKWVARAARFK